MIREFRPVAAGILGLRGLKLMTFGPRPQDFMACNGPIQPLFDLGVEIEENSELDLLVAYRKQRSGFQDSQTCLPNGQRAGRGQSDGRCTASPCPI